MTVPMAAHSHSSSLALSNDLQFLRLSGSSPIATEGLCDLILLLIGENLYNILFSTSTLTPRVAESKRKNIEHALQRVQFAWMAASLLHYCGKIFYCPASLSEGEG